MGLSRQQSGSMTSYIQRRKRWWQLLTQMDKPLSMSDVMLGELLLEHAGLTSTERLLVMTSTNNDLSIDKVADALVKQNALSKESSRDYHSGQGKGGKKGHWRSNPSRGYLAYDDENGEFDYPEEDYAPGNEAYLGYDTSGYDGCGGKKGYHGGNLSLEDRKKRLQEFKAKTKCQDCGKIGHWAGNPECQRKKGVLG